LSSTTDRETRFNTLVNRGEKADEVLRAVLLLAGRDDFAGRDVESSEEIERAVSDVIVSASFRLPEVHRQDRLCALQRLDLRFLVEGEHHRVVGRIHVEPDHVTHLGDELRVLRDLEGPGDVRLEAERPPHPADRRVAHADVRGHTPRAPVGFPLRFLLEGLHQDRLDRVVADRPRRSDSGFVVETVEPLFDEPLSPFPHGLNRRSITVRHRSVRHSRTAGDDEPRAKRQAAIDARPPRKSGKFKARLPTASVPPRAVPAFPWPA